MDTTVGALYDKHLHSDSECVEKECNVLVLLWLQASSFITISFLSYRPIISEQPSYFDRLLPEKKPLTILHANPSDHVPGAFNVSSYRTLHDRSRCFLIRESDF